MKKEVLFVGKNLEQVHAANAEDINFGDNAENICDQDDQTFGAENTDTQTFGTENTDTQKCTTSTNSNFAEQLTQPAPPQKTNSARVPHIGFPALRAEAVTLCQLGSRNNKLAKSLMEVFKLLYSTILAIQEEDP